MGLFGKSQQKDPKDMVNEWCHKIRKEGYQLDRQIRSIEREEEKAKRSLKEAAKKNDKESCVVLAKEIVGSRKAKNKIRTSKTQLSSIQMQMKNQLSTLRVAGSLQKSTEVMQMMQNLVKVPEVAATMRDLSKEMMKAGIIDEMLDETLDSVTGEDVDDMEEEIQTEVNKVIEEIAAGALINAPATVTEVPGASGSKAKPEQVEDLSEEEDEEAIKEMQNRLQALRS
ncbi:charged multivesicular body protein 3 [Planococcus citri]|uniref:charged multivesicular body protein 3 n=1 Tax=Planococcus citri TaxID=170843 RepID=UPI0031F7BC2A